MLTVVCVCLGVALVVAFQLMNQSVIQGFMDSTEAMAGRSALTITAGEGDTFGESLAQEVSAVPGVALAVPLVRGTAFMDDRGGETLVVHGIDLTHDAAVRVYHEAGSGNPIQDMVEFLNQPDSVLMVRDFAAEHGLVNGSQIRLATPSGLREFTVRGLLEPQGLALALGGRLVVMDLFAAERAFTSEGRINQIDILVAEASNPDEVRKALVRVLPPGLTVEQSEIRKEFVRKSIAGFQAMVTGFSVLAVIAGLVVCYSRLAAVFESRVWEIGILRAIGLRQRLVLWELLKEALILGICGTVAGLALGTFIGRRALPFLAEATAIAFRQAVPTVRPELSPAGLLLGVLVGLSSAIAAAAVPALRLSRTQPAVALSMRGREMPMENIAARWKLRAFVTLLLVGLITFQLVFHNSSAGIATTVLIGVLVCLLAAPVVQYGERIFSGPWHRLFGPVGRHATSELGRHPRRISLIVATLGLGLGVVLLFGMLGWSFELTLAGILQKSLRADYVVTSAYVTGGYWSAPISERVVDEISAIPGVAVSAGEQSKEVTFSSGAIYVKSYDPIAFDDRRVYEWPISEGAEGALLRVRDGTAVLVTRAFAHAYGTQPGATLHVDTPSGVVDFHVAAITDAPVENAIVMSRVLYRSTWTDDMISLVHVVVESGVGKDSVRQAILETLSKQFRLLVRPRDEIITYFVDQVRRAFSVLYLMEAATFLLVLMGIGDALVASVVERTREIGMMRALGLTRNRLFGIILLEGVTVGLLGLLLALGAGLALGTFWVQVQFPAILGWKIDMHFPTKFAVGAAVITLTLCLIGSFLPSLRAARMSVPEAIRDE